jgi:trk system potassium uptake protein TrkH
VRSVRFTLDGRRGSSLLRNPALMIVSSFAVLILVGTFFLMLPVMNRQGQITSFVDALFTATSATCVTGLIIHDTYAYFNMGGQIVILCLIQLGGLGLVTLTSFFYLIIGKKLSLRTAQLAQESVSADDRINTAHLVKTVVVVTACFELVGALLLMLYFVPEFGYYGIFMSIFFAISAYCNAGFDLLGMRGEFSSLISVQENPWVLCVIMALIVSGGLGFIVWQDLWNYRRRRHLFLHSKLVLVATGILVLTGCVFFLILEWNNPRTMGDMNVGNKIINALFQSVTTRTAGFDAIGNADMTVASKFVSIVLMFIGAAPGSTGGGIKVTTIVVLLMTVYSVMRGRTDTIIRNRRVHKMVVYKSLSVFFLAAFLVLISTGVILATESSGSQIDALFESTSAFATVGLSVGVSAEAHVLSKIVLIMTMFLGRVGPVSFALSISMAAGSRERKQVMPEAKIWVG